MIILDAIVLTFLNAFDQIDWKFAKYSNYLILIKGGPESGALTFVSFVLSIIISIPLISIFGQGMILITILLFLVFCKMTDKRYSGKYKMINDIVSKSPFKSRSIRRTLTTLFLIIPVIEPIIIRNFASA